MGEIRCEMVESCCSGEKVRGGRGKQGAREVKGLGGDGFSAGRNMGGGAQHVDVGEGGQDQSKSWTGL